jgi:hypothetical protein
VYILWSCLNSLYIYSYTKFLKMQKWRTLWTEIVETDMFIVVYDFKDSLLIFDVNYRSNYLYPISNYIVYRLQGEFRIMTKFDWNHFICVSFRTTKFRIWRYPWHVLLFQRELINIFDALTLVCISCGHVWTVCIYIPIQNF